MVILDIGNGLYRWIPHDSVGFIGQYEPGQYVLEIYRDGTWQSWILFVSLRIFRVMGSPDF